MGVYYFLLNDTKRERVHLDYYVKRGPLTANRAVHFALVNYAMDNTGDTLRLCDDTGSEGDNYEEVNLLTYDFADERVLPEVIRLLGEAP